MHIMHKALCGTCTNVCAPPILKNMERRHDIDTQDENEIDFASIGATYVTLGQLAYETLLEDVRTQGMLVALDVLAIASKDCHAVEPITIRAIRHVFGDKFVNTNLEVTL